MGGHEFATESLPSFGVRVDYDLAWPLDEAGQSALRALLYEHGLLVFRDQALSNADQERVLGYFGTILGEEGENRADLLYASITTRNETFRYYRFQTPDDQMVDFYDENGRSSRKFLIRKPITAGETRSGFGMRRHPILGYTRMHTGVDWSAPVGTPIFAAGNGTVIKAGRESGYGNRVEIQHANGYITTYNHMTGFARGITEGTRVRQGQVIGFLGMTGLATGPHLHYEVMVNGHFVDPLRVRLARTRELDNRMLANFKRERDRIESIMAKAPNATRVAAARTDTRPSVQR